MVKTESALEDNNRHTGEIHMTGTQHNSTEPYKQDDRCGSIQTVVMRPRRYDATKRMDSTDRTTRGAL